MKVKGIKGKGQDSLNAFLISQLDAFDQTIHKPLFSTSWMRDIDLRGDVSIANESTSFTRTTFGGVGTNKSNSLTGIGIPWMNENANKKSEINVTRSREINLVRPIQFDLDYNTIELKKAAKAQMNLEQEKHEGISTYYQMVVDAVVNVGASDMGEEGMFNNSAVESGNATTLAWNNSTSVEDILSAINEMLDKCWSNSGWAVVPSSLRLPPTIFSYLNKRIVSDAGNKSVLTYIRENNLFKATTGQDLDIQPLKWLETLGASGTKRMVAYTKQKEYVRYPLVPLFREAPSYSRGVYNIPYIAGLGVVEIVKPETMIYRDGI